MPKSAARCHARCSEAEVESLLGAPRWRTRSASAIHMLECCMRPGAGIGAGEPKLGQINLNQALPAYSARAIGTADSAGRGAGAAGLKAFIAGARNDNPAGSQ